jgi:biopolymer transport protein ExbB
MTDALPEVKTRIGALWSMANIVTLTGLLGTITGLIRTFSAVKGEDPAKRQDALSDGIAEAMYNTAFGLSIALVCMLAHLLLSAAMKRVISDLEAFSLRFENLLAEGNAPAGGAARAPGAPPADADLDSGDGAQR